MHQRIRSRGSWFVVLTTSAILLTGAVAAGASAGKSNGPTRAIASAGPAGGIGYSTNTQTGQSIIPGTTDLGNHCDDCSTAITRPASD